MTTVGTRVVIDKLNSKTYAVRRGFASPRVAYVDLLAAPDEGVDQQEAPQPAPPPPPTSSTTPSTSRNETQFSVAFTTAVASTIAYFRAQEEEHWAGRLANPLGIFGIYVVVFFDRVAAVAWPMSKKP